MAPCQGTSCASPQTPRQPPRQHQGWQKDPPQMTGPISTPQSGFLGAFSPRMAGTSRRQTQSLRSRGLVLGPRITQARTPPWDEGLAPALHTP